MMTHIIPSSEPVFIKIQKIPDSAEKNDDKLYFFFREKSLDTSGGSAPSVLARVGRVCLVRKNICLLKPHYGFFHQLSIMRIFVMQIGI